MSNLWRASIVWWDRDMGAAPFTLPFVPPRLSPYSHDTDRLYSSQDHIPLAALPLLATSSGSYLHALGTVVTRANQAYGAFLRSREGAGFCGQVRGIWGAAGAWLHREPLCPSVEGLGALSFTPLAVGACCLQVVLLGDCVGGILGFDALCQTRVGSGGSRGSSRRGSLVSTSTLPGLRRGLHLWVLVVAEQGWVLTAFLPAEHGAHLPGAVWRSGPTG